MRKLSFILVLGVLLTCCTDSGTKRDSSRKGDSAARVSAADTATAKTVDDQLPEGVRRLIDAYHDAGITFDSNSITVNGESIVYDDGKKKSFVERLDNSDVEDMFVQPYDTSVTTPPHLSDPGRSRCEALYKAMYGHNEAEVRQRLIRVDWFGQKLPFTTVNGADRQLAAVAQELAKHPELAKYLTPATTFYWRNVRGFDRLSAHSYGMTIDINVANSDFWLWANPKKSETDTIAYKNRIPLEVVKIFEKHGFIWGGRWYHFDTMHFEYRPELLNGNNN